jgi:thioesterase domain-containing protein
VRDPIRGFVDATPRTLREVENATRKASDVYVPRPYPGKLTLFRATKQPAGIYPDPHLGWSDLAAGGIDVYDVPGHHGAIVYEPRVGALAARLEECLAAAGRAS